MGSKSNRQWWTLAAIGLLATACTTSVVDPNENPSTGGSGGAGATGGSGGAGATAGSGGSGGDPGQLTQDSAISECGGFAQQNDSGGPGSGEPTEYCDAEVLHWTYDAALEQLFLSDNRVELNCCGEHAIAMTKQGDVYVVTETDAPEIYAGEPARCNCDCVFDFSMTASPIPEQAIQLRVIRDVTDSGQGPQTVFDGTIDLSEAYGSIVIDDTPAYNCGWDTVS